jgi:hypothetical protein
MDLGICISAHKLSAKERDEPWLFPMILSQRHFGQIRAFTYDNSGNLTLFGGTAMTYDAENRMNLEGQTGVEAVLYRYDGAGQRVESCQTNTPGVCDPAGAQTCHRIGRDAA